MEYRNAFFAVACVVGMGACASAPPVAPLASLTPSATLMAPEPIEGNSGQYMSPYTSDEVVAEWVDKAINAKMGASLGGTAGRYAGEKMMENVPFVGGFLGKSVGESIGRGIAMDAVGGEEFIRQTSDLSFNSVDDLALYLFVEHSQRENFQQVLAATQEIYPELKTAYEPTVRSALS
tara:strand:+ start:2651 stop:3184 length:534 start_codon:yes stop_codon:yes gene_type:complete